MARYIDAEEFLDLFYVAAFKQDKLFVKTVEMVVDDTPTADVVEVKHGFNTGNANIFECSVCGYGVDDIYEADEKNYPVWEFNFCPHCGAKMDGGNAE